METRPIWQGLISFGLVNIPVKLYSAVSHKATKFRLVHKKDKSPVKYRKFCEKEDKEIEWEDISKALEVSKGNYVIVDQKELEKIKPEKSNNLDILEFIDQSQLDPIYFSTSYYLVPAKSKEKAYFLFKKVLQTSSKTAIGKYILREKEYICAISSYKNGLLLSNLNYDYEIKDIGVFEELKQIPSVREEEMQLAEQLIKNLTKEEVDMGKFKDTYEEQLKKLISKKESGELARPVKKRIMKEENLITALKASLKK